MTGLTGVVTNVGGGCGVILMGEIVTKRGPLCQTGLRRVIIGKS